MFFRIRITTIAIAAVTIIVSGCTVHPPGEREERAAASQAGRPFERPIDARPLPPLRDNPTPDQLVEYAYASSGALEQAYWQWRSAIEQIPQDGTQTTTLNLSAGAAVTNGHTGLSNTTLALSNDPMTDIKWPDKLDAAAKQALENARAAGRRFVKAKFELRGRVLSAWDDYTLTAESIRLEQSNLQLLQTILAATEARNRAGSAAQQDVLKASNEVDLSRNDIAGMQSQLPAQRAAINALLDRPAGAPLSLPAQLPPGPPLRGSDAELLALAARRNPELLALADEIRARQQSIRLAQLQYLPDFNLSAGTDLMGVTQSILGQATIPFFRHEALDAAIAQARANLSAAEAMRRQTGDDLAARVVADLAAIRDADHQLALFDGTLLPRRAGGGSGALRL